MYPYFFGISDLRTYDVIGVLGYGLLIWYLLDKKTRPARADRVGKSAFWAVCLPLAVHLMAYTFGGNRLGDWIGRGTDFYGYVAVSAAGTVLAAYVLEERPAVWLDRTVPLYLAVASALKIGCFCGGCCEGMPWRWGLYNQQTGRTEFPIQLVEMAVYALLLVLLSRYRGRDGQRFALFLMGYAAVRFAVQFVRTDVAVFSLFHWLSAVVFGIGALCLCVFHVKQKRTDI